MTGTTELNILFEQTLQGDYDSDAPWEAVNNLRTIGSKEVFDRAEQFCNSVDPKKRARGADILAQLGVAIGQSHPYPEQTKRIIEELLVNEKSAAVLSSAIHALGHLGNIESVISVLQFSTHVDAGVRYAVAVALGSFANDEQALFCLIDLMNDPDEEVRNWATFGLGVQGEIDTPAVRMALLNRLNDSHLETRTEAFAGLAKRGDLRMIPNLLEYFDAKWISNPAIEASMKFLELEAEPENWGAADYAAALRRKFSI